jgi:O-methyltransferase
MGIFKRLRSRNVALPALPPGPERFVSFFLPVLFGARDPEAVARHVKAAAELVTPGVHFADNLFAWGRNLSFLDDPAFVRAMDQNAESDADRAIIWRRYVLACAGYHCLQLPGDFVECGVYTGVGVKTVVDYLGGTAFAKTFWAYDLFVHDPGMAHHAMPEHGAALEERVRAKFAAYPQVRVVKGMIPEVFAGQSPKAIAYLHIDLNEAPAEVAALDALFDRIVPGGLVVLDDYEWSGYRKQKLAEDPWFEARHYRVFPLPTGQGIVIKR